MKKGINAWCFPGDISLEDCFRVAKTKGYDGIELNMDENGAGLGLTPDSDQSVYKEILEISKRYDLPVYSVSTGLHWKYSLTAEDESVRVKGMDIVRKMLEAANALGADTILTVPGLVTEAVSYKKAYERSLAAFTELKSSAEEKEVTIGIENVWNKFLLSPLEMRRFIDEIDSPRVGAYFDAGNVLQFSFPEHWVEALSGKIAKVHVKDFDTSIGNIYGFRPLLQGGLNWENLMRALKKAGYDDYITPELAPYKTNPLQLIEDTSRALDYIIGLV